MTDVLYGSLGLIILKTLEALGPLHGYRIARRIEQLSGDHLALNKTLYPALLKLEQAGWIRSSWGESDSGRAVKNLHAHQGRPETPRSGRGGLATCDGHCRAILEDSGRAIVTVLRILLARLLGLFGADTRRERELRAEIDTHIAEATDEYVRQGMTPEEARHLALRRFGGVTQTVEAHRAQRRFTFFSTLRQDVQSAARTLIRAPGFAIVAILTLAIGILGNTTIFSGVNALLFTPLPTERPEQIAQVLAGSQIEQRFAKHTYRLYTALRDNNSSFAGLAGIRDVTVPSPIRLRTRGRNSTLAWPAARSRAATTSRCSACTRRKAALYYAGPRYFQTMGIPVAAGRDFDERDTANSTQVAILSEAVARGSSAPLGTPSASVSMPTRTGRAPGLKSWAWSTTRAVVVDRERSTESCMCHRCSGSPVKR